jgi:hypothetical protein
MHESSKIQKKLVTICIEGNERAVFVSGRALNHSSSLVKCLSC